MLLKSLYIKNFRQFKGETTIEFAYDKEKNVTIILGDNTYGKTTLLQAFNWCLYDFVIFDKDSNPDMLLNLELASQMQYGSREIVEVKIILIHKIQSISFQGHKNTFGKIIKYEVKNQRSRCHIDFLALMDKQILEIST